MKKKEKNTEKKTGYSISDPVETIENKGNKINLESESTKFIVILLCIVAFIAMLWLVDTLKNNKEEDKKDEPTTVKIDYSEVLVGNMLDQKPEKYLVYAYKTDKDATIEYLLTNAGDNYKLNLDLANNKIAVAETSNFTGTIDQIKFKGETLLVIEKGKITKAYEGADDITKYLQSLEK